MDTTDVKLPENKPDLPFATAEWKMLLQLTQSRQLMPILQSLMSFTKKHYSTITLADVEQELRKENSCLYLFAEDPHCCRFNRGCIPANLDPSNHKPAKYLLAASTKTGSRRSFMKDFEKGCWDEKTNLERLKDAGFATLPGLSADDSKAGVNEPESPEHWKKIVMHMLRGSINYKTGDIMELSFEAFDALRDLINSGDPDAIDLWQKQRIFYKYQNLVAVPPSLQGNDNNGDSPKSSSDK